jgi:transcription factor SPN1
MAAEDRDQGATVSMAELVAHAESGTASLAQSIFGAEDSDSEDDLFGGGVDQQLARSAQSTQSRVQRLAASKSRRTKRKRGDSSNSAPKKKSSTKSGTGKKTRAKQSKKSRATPDSVEHEHEEAERPQAIRAGIGEISAVTSGGEEEHEHEHENGQERESEEGAARERTGSHTTQKGRVQKRKRAMRSAASGNGSDAGEGAAEEGRVQHDEDDEDDEVAAVTAEAVQKTVWQQTLDSLKSTYRRSREVNPDHAASYVVQLRMHMDEATAADRDANRRQWPALARLKLLPMVREALGKKHLLQYFIEHDVLHSLRQWLEPLPDGSLPNSAIRLCVLESLQLMPCESGDLRDSGIGRAVMYMWKACGQQGSSNYAPQHREIAAKLIEKWSRPIFQLSTDYRDANHEEDNTPHLSRDIRTHTNVERHGEYVFLLVATLLSLSLSRALSLSLSLSLGSRVFYFPSVVLLCVRWTYECSWRSPFFLCVCVCVFFDSLAPTCVCLSVCSYCSCEVLGRFL